MKKQFKTFLAVLTLVAITVNVCFAADVGIPAATHSSIIKEIPVPVEINNNIQPAAVMQHVDILMPIITQTKKHCTVFPVPPLSAKYISNKPTMAWSCC